MFQWLHFVRTWYRCKWTLERFYNFVLKTQIEVKEQRHYCCPCYYFYFYSCLKLCFYSLACGPYEYSCANLRCIPDSRLCDLHNDCGDGSDEHMCNKELTTDDILSPPVIVGVVTGCVVFIIIIVVATIIYLKWKRRKRKTTGNL